MYAATTTTSVMERFNGQYFNWLSWRSGSILSVFKIPHRYYAISANADVIRRFAIGWCNAQNMPCMPKNGYIAVMFNTGGLEDWWTHLTIKEFNVCFPELEEYTKSIRI